MRLENETRKRFSEDICCVFDPWNVIDDERSGFNVRANEVIMDINVLGLPVVGVIDGERLGTVVVSQDNKQLRTVNVKLIKGLSKPDPFLNGTCEGNIFGLSSGKSHAVLLFS